MILIKFFKKFRTFEVLYYHPKKHRNIVLVQNTKPNKYQNVIFFFLITYNYILNFSFAKYKKNKKKRL